MQKKYWRKHGLSVGDHPDNGPKERAARLAGHVVAGDEKFSDHTACEFCGMLSPRDSFLCCAQAALSL